MGKPQHTRAACGDDTACVEMWVREADGDGRRFAIRQTT